MRKILSLFFLFGSTVMSQSYELKVEVRGIPSGKGKVLVGVYNKAEGFRDKSFAVASAEASARQGILVLSIANLKPGTYALAVFHDENGNGKLDTNFLGIPTESYGFSNDARGSFGPPDFSDCSFSLQGSKSVQLTLKK
jgi:uncharacterized protein (DUF2141 family)